MARSFLATIRQAVTQEPFAADPQPAAPAVTGAAPPPSNDLEAAVAAARAEGEAAATKRIATILSAEGIMGDAGRMSAAIDVASKSPTMSADAVISFVTTNISAEAAVPKASAAALANRIAADAADDPIGAAMGGYLPPASADGWAEAMSRAAGQKGEKQ